MTRLQLGTAIGTVAALIVSGIAWTSMQDGQPAPSATPARAPKPPPLLPPEERPNVLFIVWDTVRADRLSVYGHDKPTTPFLEEIAPRSAVFDAAISPSFWTLPSHASLFTGLSVTTHDATASHKWLDNRFITLAEHFGDNGYDTYAWSSNPNIHPSANMVQGFRTVNHAIARSKFRDAVDAFTATLVHPDDKTTRVTEDRHTKPAFHKHGAVIEGAFTTWLDDDRQDDKPFFAFLNYMEAHAYRLPTEEARQAVMPDERSYRRALNTSNTLQRQYAVMYGKWRPYKRGERRALYDLYDASIVDLDRYLRQVFAQLEQRDLLDDTIVVLTSDHGEHFGENGLYLHTYSVYQPLVHVPLVVHWPKGVQAQRVTHPVSTRALFSTLVHLAGMPLPDQPILADTLFESPTEPVVAELTVTSGHKQEGQVRPKMDYSVRDWSARYKAIFEGDDKFIWSTNGSHELYDLAADPRESSNQVDARANAVDGFIERLDRWTAAQPVIEISDADRAAEDALQEENRDEDLQEQLEQLGYIED